MINAITASGKFTATMTALATTTALAWLDKIDGGAYSVVVIATVGAYIAGNVIEQIQETPK